MSTNNLELTKQLLHNEMQSVMKTYENWDKEDKERVQNGRPLEYDTLLLEIVRENAIKGDHMSNIEFWLDLAIVQPKFADYDSKELDEARKIILLGYANLFESDRKKTEDEKQRNHQASLGLGKKLEQIQSEGLALRHRAANTELQVQSPQRPMLMSAGTKNVTQSEDLKSQSLTQSSDKNGSGRFGCSIM